MKHSFAYMIYTVIALIPPSLYASKEVRPYTLLAIILVGGFAYVIFLLSEISRKIEEKEFPN